MRSYYLILPLACLFFGCDLSGPSRDVIDYGNIWPLKTGNVWYYKIVQPSYIQDTLKMEVVGTMPVQFGGKKYTVSKVVMYGSSEAVPEYQWLYWKGPDGIYLMGGVSVTDTFVVKELELKYPANIGDSWEYRPVAYSHDKKEFYSREPVTFTIISNDTLVETPLGTYPCYQYRFSQRPADDVGDIWDYNYFYSIELGQIQEETISQFANKAVEKYTIIKNQIQ